MGMILDYVGADSVLELDLDKMNGNLNSQFRALDAEGWNLRYEESDRFDRSVFLCAKDKTKIVGSNLLRTLINYRTTYTAEKFRALSEELRLALQRDIALEKSLNGDMRFYAIPLSLRKGRLTMCFDCVSRNYYRESWKSLADKDIEVQLIKMPLEITIPDSTLQLQMALNALTCDIYTAFAHLYGDMSGRDGSPILTVPSEIINAVDNCWFYGNLSRASIFSQGNMAFITRKAVCMSSLDMHTLGDSDCLHQLIRLSRECITNPDVPFMLRENGKTVIKHPVYYCNPTELKALRYTLAFVVDSKRTLYLQAHSSWRNKVVEAPTFKGFTPNVYILGESFLSLYGFLFLNSPSERNAYKALPNALYEVLRGADCVSVECYRTWGYAFRVSAMPEYVKEYFCKHDTGIEFHTFSGAVYLCPKGSFTGNAFTMTGYTDVWKRRLGSLMRKADVCYVNPFNTLCCDSVNCVLKRDLRYGVELDCLNADIDEISYRVCGMKIAKFFPPAFELPVDATALALQSLTDTHMVVSVPISTSRTENDYLKGSNGRNAAYSVLLFLYFLATCENADSISSNILVVRQVFDKYLEKTVEFTEQLLKHESGDKFRQFLSLIIYGWNWGTTEDFKDNTAEFCKEFKWHYEAIQMLQSRIPDLI